MRPVPVLTAAIGVIGANSLVLPPIAVSVATNLGTDPARVLRAAAAYGLGTALSALVLAPRADRVGADRALMTAVLVLIVALAASALAPGIAVLMAAQALAGVGAGMALPAIYALAPQVAPKGREKQTLGVILTGWTISIVGGVTLSAFLADLAGWRAVFGLLGALTVILTVLLYLTPIVATRSSTATSPLTGWRVPGVKRGLFSAGMLMLAFYGTYSFIGAHVAGTLGRATSAAGIVTLFYGAGFGLSGFLDRYLDRLSHRQAATFTFSMMIGVYGAYTLAAPYFPALLAVAFCWGIIQHFGLNLVVARLSGLDPNQRGAILGLNSSVTYVCVMGGALVFRVPFEMGGFAGCAALSALCITAALIESRWPEPVKTAPSDE